MRGFGGYQRQCQHCIVAAIEKFPDDEWFVECATEAGFVIDRNTIQLVLDMLNQKFGLTK